MRCHEALPLKEAHLRGALSDEQSFEVETHLESCSSCRRSFAEADSVVPRLQAFFRTAQESLPEPSAFVFPAAAPASAHETEGREGSGARSWLSLLCQWRPWLSVGVALACTVALIVWFGFPPGSGSTTSLKQSSAAQVEWQLVSGRLVRPSAAVDRSLAEFRAASELHGQWLLSGRNLGVRVVGPEPEFRVEDTAVTLKHGVVRLDWQGAPRVMNLVWQDNCLTVRGTRVIFAANRDRCLVQVARGRVELGTGSSSRTLPVGPVCEVPSGSIVRSGVSKPDSQYHYTEIFAMLKGEGAASAGAAAMTEPA